MIKRPGVARALIQTVLLTIKALVNDFAFFFLIIKMLPKQNFIFLGHLNPKESWNHMLGNKFY